MTEPLRIRNIPLREFRCECGKLLFKGSLLVANVEIKCRRCSQIRRFVAKPVTTSR